MNTNISDRVLAEAKLVRDNNYTIRKVASIESVSKSTVHKDLQIRLKELNLELYTVVQAIFQEHIETRHIKGGESTRKKYQKSLQMKHKTIH